MSQAETSLLPMAPVRGPLHLVVGPLVRLIVTLARKKPLGFWGGLVPLLLIVALALAAPVVSQAPPNHQNGKVLLQGPSRGHWFGNDEYGRDLFARTTYGARVSLVVGFASVALGIGLATVVGLVSGGLGGWVDLTLQRVIDVLMAFPGFILILLIAAILGAGERNTIIAIGLLLTFGSSRLVRAQVFVVRESPFIEAARTVGCSEVRVLLRHIFPNVLDVVVVLASINLAFAIIMEASLSFIGLGVPPPTPSWGSMVSSTESAYLVHAPWIVLSAGGALALTVYACNMLGDALRDLLDPRLRQL